jgi:HEPN domain-containing protein
MAAIIDDCPHCGGQKIGFSFVADSNLAPARQQQFMTTYKCNKCQGGLIVVYKQNVKHPKVEGPGTAPSDPMDVGFSVVEKYPTKMLARLPSHLPEPLGRFFQQANDGLRRGDYDASGAMSRKVVDVSTQKLLGDESRKYGNIRDRIDALEAKGGLTADLKDWAHEVRLGGNDAAHDEDPFSREEAEELLDFAELYLTYVHTLPARLKERREKAAAEKAIKAAG